MQTTAFINEDGKVVVIVMNQSKLKITYNLCIDWKPALNLVGYSGFWYQTEPHARFPKLPDWQKLEVN